MDMGRKRSSDSSLKCCICGRRIEKLEFSVELAPGSRAHMECAAERAMNLRKKLKGGFKRLAKRA